MAFAKKLASVASLLPSSRHQTITFFIPLFHFSTQTEQKEDLPLIAQYLISSFGFSKDLALRYSTNKRYISLLKSPERPESVVRFLKDTGLTDAQTKTAIFCTPQLLCLSVSKTLEPRVHELISAGFTREIIIQLVRFSPMVLAYRKVLSRLQFWRNFVGNSDEALLKVIKAKRILNADIDKRVIPQIHLLREYGLSDEQIAAISVQTNLFLHQGPEFIHSKIELVEKLGFPRKSKMFSVGLGVIGNMKKDILDKRVAFFKTTYGWSDEDINLAVLKYPKILTYTEDKIKSTMDFLIENVGIKPSKIALWSRLVGCSLKCRLIPRHYVLTVLKLKSKGLKTNWNLLSMFIMSEKLFLEKYILPYKEELPNLEEEYAAACAGKLPLL